MARINAVSFHQDPFPESICRKVRAAGFDSLEVSRPPFFEKFTTRRTRQAFADYAKSLGLGLYGFDCWVDVLPYTAREETVRGFRAAMDFAADLNLGMVISHDPWAHVNQDRSPAECLRQNLSLFQEVADLAAARGLTLIFEPHPDTCSMNNQWAIDFIDGLDRPNVGLLYDCCHYGVGQPQGYLDAIRILGQRIRHIHFSDGDRRTYALHLPIGEGELDLSAVVREFRQLGFAGTLTNDLFNYPLLEEGARRNAEPIREIEVALAIQTSQPA